MRSLITGGGGFIGSHLAEHLLAEGHDVSVIDDYSTGRPENIAHLRSNPRFSVTEGSVLDYPLLEGLVAECDQIFHLAAAVGVKLIIQEPIQTLLTNVRGTEILLDLASKYEKKLLIASTSEVYGKAMETDGKIFALGEDDDWTLGATTRKRWAYACSKAMDEFLALAYYEERELPVIIARYFNTVGPRQTGKYGMVIPRFVERALRGDPIPVHGDGTQSRSFTHVSDAVWATARLMETDEAPGQVYNVGNGAEITIGDLAVKVREMAESDSPIEYIPYEVAYQKGFEDMQRRTPDIGKLSEATGYRPRHDLEGILQDVIDYFRAKEEEPVAAPAELRKVAAM